MDMVTTIQLKVGCAYQKNELKFIVLSQKANMFHIFILPDKIKARCFFDLKETFVELSQEELDLLTLEYL